MSKEEPTSQPPPYSSCAGVDGSTYPPQNPAYPPQYNNPVPPPGYPGGYAHPGQPGYSQPFGTQQTGYNATTVVLAQPTIAVIQTFREVPVRTSCPHCRADIVTATHYETGTFTWVVCFVLCIFGCVLGCCLFPFCIDGCRDVIHSCPNCRQQVARFNRM